MTKKNKELKKLHSALCTELLKRVVGGKATSMDLSVAAKFLKDNGMDTNVMTTSLPDVALPMDILNNLPFDAPQKH